MANQDSSSAATATATAAGVAASADFGVAGKLTIRADVPATAIHIDQGEFLSYDLVVHGVDPIFTLACKHRRVKSDDDFPVGSHFAWTHFQAAGDEDSHDDTYTLGLSFLSAPIKYSLVVKRCDSTGAPMQTLKDKDFESTDPSDFFLDGLRVFSL